MKILEEWKQPEEPREVVKVKPGIVNLGEISDIINSINEAVAPELSKDVADAKTALDKKNAEDRAELVKIQKLNDKYTKLKMERVMLQKKSKAVELLGNIYATYNVSDKMLKEMIAVMSNLDTYDEKRLDRQIAKLENFAAPQ
jgi:hypothetical protein